jgi:hypothetical protein
VTYSEFQHIDVAGLDGATDFGLALPAFNTDNVLLAPSVGLEWSGGDHWSFSLVPRAHFLLGPEPTFAIVVPLTVSWSWYL